MSDSSERNAPHPDPESRLNRTQIVVAIIGFVGVVLAAYIGFLGVQYASEAPLRASQTAEAQRNIGALSEPTNTPRLSEPTRAPADTPTAESDPPAPTPDLEIAIQDPCPLTSMMPGFLDPQGSRAIAEKAVEDAYNNDDIYQWPMIGTGFETWISLLSSFDNRAWIRLSNTANITVSVLGDSPPHANGVEIGECGSTGFIRNFPSIPLSRDFDTYSRKVTSTDADFFTLQPGEFEIWEVLYTCEAPGRYRLAVEIPYAYDGGDSKLIANSQEIICPLEYDEWTMQMGPLQFARSFLWDGSRYQQTSP